jgi:MoaA/NifB/PqqE/SkfB family radical SAM enzyme
MFSKDELIKFRKISSKIDYKEYNYNDIDEAMMFYYWKDMNNHSRIKNNIINLLVNDGTLPYREKIWIETVNFCNINCPFCPIGRKMNKAEPHFISDKVYNHILKLLSKYPDWDGTLSPFGHGEPLLDPDIFNKINEIKTILPKCRIVLSTNSTKLVDRFDELMKSKCDFLICNFYLPETEKECLELFEKHPEIEFTFYEGEFGSVNGKVNIFYRRRFNDEDGSPKFEKWYTNRVGLLPELGGKIIDTPCIFPFFQLVFNVDGDMKLCCYDSIGLTIFDNVMNYDDIDDLWNSVKYQTIRNKIKESRFNIDYCKNCNTNDCIATENIYR